MSDWGIKVVNAGTSVLSTDIRDQIMNTQYSMFKYHSDTLGTVTINAGETAAYGTITHNLGYVPAFLPYVNDPNDTLQRLVPSIPFGIDFDHYFEAYAGTQNIVFGYHLDTPYNRQIITASDYYNSYFGAENTIWIGRIGATGANGAIRFGSVAVTGSETITSAKVNIYVNNKDGSTSLNVKWDNYGIDEDNTDVFGDPFGRTRTTATSYQTRSVPTNLGDYVEIDETNMFNEIRQRAGWSSGNAMGFTMIERDGDNDAWFLDSVPPYSYLQIDKPGSANIVFRVIIFKDKIV